MTDSELMVMRLDLRKMVVDVDNAPVGANINKVKTGLISRYGAFLSEAEGPDCDTPEPF